MIVVASVVVASVDGHMADDEFNGCARDSKREVIVTRWYISLEQHLLLLTL
jgi:hypothetical protein